MGWRFRKSFTIIPGVRLNLSKSGLSASVGGAPFTINAGNKGLMLTGSVPGTGISYRQHFSGKQLQSRLFTPSSSPSSPTLIPNQSPGQEIRSVGAELLTSESLKEFKHLIQTTHEEREEISRELNAALAESKRNSSGYSSWENGFLFKRLFKDSFERRKVASEESAAKVKELEEQLCLTSITTQIEIAKEQAEPYSRLRDEFASLSACAAIWDIKATQYVDRVQARAFASTAITRERAVFSLDTCDLIQWGEKLPHLCNSKGGELYLYPGFILYRAGETFSLLDFHDVKIRCSYTQFQEEEQIPKDSKVVGQTWKKVNKDGSRDKRFMGNFQIPLVRYGQLSLKSESGLREEFMFSAPEPLERVLKAWGVFTASFGAGEKIPETTASVVANEDGVTGIVKGILRNPATGAAWAGVKMSLKSKTTGEVHTTTTGCGGEYEFCVVSDNYAVIVDE
jgi:hypothetical protein